MALMYGTSYVAEYLGVSPSVIYLWLKDSKNGFPRPDIEIVGYGERRVGQAWASGALSLMRPWYIEHRNLPPSEAASRWGRVDAKRSIRVVSTRGEASHAA